MADDDIGEWRSVVTLVVFIVTNLIVLFPFHIPIPFPRSWYNGIKGSLARWRVISPGTADSGSGFMWLQFPVNFVTAPIIADLFLLAISAIGRREIKEGTLGDKNISPLDIMLFFFTLAYIAISLDASGLIRWLAFKVLQKGGKVGHRLFFYLYSFFFVIGSFIGNDPIVLSGTAFLAYMTRVSSNIIHPRAWIHTQFAIANIASAILVSSNPTNLVLAGAFGIKFIDYTVRMIVPVVITALVLFPFLLYVVFANEDLIPESIAMHELPEELRAKKPVNPNIPNARGYDDEEESIHLNDETGKQMSLEEIMNPYIDWGGAAFGAIIMTTTLVTLLVLNAVGTDGSEHKIFWVTLPAAVVMFCWDLTFGWIHREQTRQIAREGRRQVEEHRAARKAQAEQEQARRLHPDQYADPNVVAMDHQPGADEPPRGRRLSAADDHHHHVDARRGSDEGNGSAGDDVITPMETRVPTENSTAVLLPDPTNQEKAGGVVLHHGSSPTTSSSMEPDSINAMEPLSSRDEMDEKSGGIGIGIGGGVPVDLERNEEKPRPVVEAKPPKLQTWGTRLADTHEWCKETFPTVTAVLGHLPYALAPFAFAMFILVQALVTKGWVYKFAQGWDAWVKNTGTIGAIGGMGFLSVILCNFAGTNIGTTILLCRMIIKWAEQRELDNSPISERTFIGTVYSMALGVNYGAFSTAFSASLAGLLWRDILRRKHINVGAREFARNNIPIIAIAMTVGCAALIGEVYIIFKEVPYNVNHFLHPEEETGH